MKKKKLAVEAAAAESVQTTAPERSAKKQKNGSGDIRDMHSLFFVIGIVLGVISILFTIIAKNGINGAGYFAFTPFEGIRKLFTDKPINPIKVTFLTSSLSAWIAGGLAVLSVGCGVTRNILKKQNSLIGYLIGLVALILAALALLAVRYP